MLKHRIIPVLLWNGKQVVQTTQFKRPHRNVGSMMQHIRVMETRNIDELIILDIEATSKQRKPLFDEIKEFTKELFCPVTIGGGITSLDDIGKLIQECGADKVAINSHIWDDDKFLYAAANKYGAQAIVAALDIFTTSENNKITRKCGHMWSTGDIKVASQWLQQNGAGEILLTSISNNGMQCGYECELIEKVTDAVDIPVIANGGCGKPLDMLGAIAYGASAVAASSMFLFTDHTPKTCAKVLHEAGLAVRLDG